MADAKVFTNIDSPVWGSDDGVTHGVYFGIDNRPSNPESTQSVDFRVDKPTEIDSIGYSWASPNFFDGYSTALQYSNPIGQMSGRAVFGGGPSNKIGNVMKYEVKINQANLGVLPQQVTFTVNPDDIFLTNGFGDLVPYTIQNASVWVTKAGDNNLDGRVNIDDLSMLASNWMGTGKVWGDGDFTRDGNVNIDDLSGLAGNWNYGVSQGISFTDGLRQTGLGNVGIPEPSSGLLLIALGAVAAGRRFGRALGLNSGRKYDRAYDREVREGRK